jgi:hypothetical protein
MNRLIVAAIRCLLTFILPTSKAKKATLLLFSVAMLLAGGAAAVRGQSALDSFDPSPNKAVFVIVVQPDGKILIGGGFTTLSPNGGPPVTRNYIARLNTDGTLDTAFNANFDPNPNTIRSHWYVRARGSTQPTATRAQNFRLIFWQR